MRRGVRGGVFGALEGCFAGDFGAATRHEWDADGAFCRGIPGFWPGRGRGAAIQRTADADRVVGQKNFLKRGEKLRKTRKIGVREVPEGGLGTP